MAGRSKKGTSGKVTRFVEEAQNVGVDVVPTVEITTAPTTESRQATSLLSDWDYHLFNEGSHHRLWEKLGAHVMEREGVRGTMFAVWAPNAESVSVMGDFNGWNRDAHRLESRGPSGIWEAFVSGVGKGSKYKYHIRSRHNGYRVDKADPVGIHAETPPHTASIVWDLDYDWQDEEWMRVRAQRNSFTAPMAVYEMHVGSWQRVFEENNRPMSYRELAGPLAEYLRKMNFTHVELMPVMEHPFYGSWGYQVTGFFAPTSRYGTPQDLMYMVDVLHQNGIGVIFDWVPSHFPTDEHGLSYFDGTHLYEHADPRKGFHPDWSSLIFNYGRNEVRSFLLSSALYWLGVYHVDALRVDAVASMLYLDYSRKQGEWIPNDFGGRENIEAITFIRRMNEDIYKVHPDVQVIAEESTAWPMVSRPTYIGGLGFGMKWDMGWMHDSLRYFSKDPIHRKFHHNDLTFRMMYAFTENFVLPLSHDEVVHGKGSLIGKMPGDDWQKFANLRLLFAHMYSQPGKKLLFMGGEIGQWREWNHDSSLDWHLLDYVPHAALQRWVEDLNKAYRDIPALHELDFSPDGFEWIDCCDTENCVLSLLRRSRSNPDQMVVAALNFTPVTRYNYMIGVPHSGRWMEILNSDAPLYGGSGQGNMGGVDAAPIPLHGRRWSVNLTLPPLGAVFLMNEPEQAGIDE
ncbi:MAG: 1,4-alpha-glucan branching enzyme [Acidobacteria bacterium]|nr:MAG: 1,4-alpha-glucan branching enzyme [Acidobacteriota bacterium]